MSCGKIGPTIRMLRRDVAHLSQEELAARAEISRRQLAKIEQGDVNSTIEVLHRISKGLGVTVDYLINGGACSDMLRGVLEDCSEAESAIIMDVAHATKRSLRSQTYAPREC